jgi:hypothetical protein
MICVSLRSGRYALFPPPPFRRRLIRQFEQGPQHARLPYIPRETFADVIRTRYKRKNIIITQHKTTIAIMRT